LATSTSNTRPGGKRLVLLAIGHDHFDDTPIDERSAQRRRVQRRHRGIADQQDVARRQRCLQQRMLVQQPGPDVDRVRAIFELYGECLHAAARVGGRKYTRRQRWAFAPR
jgi:hypothetical protein